MSKRMISKKEKEAIKSLANIRGHIEMLANNFEKINGYEPSILRVSQMFYDKFCVIFNGANIMGLEVVVLATLQDYKIEIG